MDENPYDNISFTPGSFGPTSGLAGQLRELSLQRQKEEQSMNIKNLFSNVLGSRNGLAQPESTPFDKNIQTSSRLPGLDNENVRYLRSKEGINNNYDTMNLAGSSAQGPYQITKGTGEWMKKKLGLKGAWNTPENQEAINIGLQNRYSKHLDMLGIKKTPKTMYVPHQLGEGRSKRYFQGTLTSKDYRVMNDNLPSKLKSDNDATVLANWTAKYNPN